MSRNNHPLAVGTTPVYGKHNLSFRHLTTLDVGRIQVMAITDCVTNDQISCDLKQVVTTAPNCAPLQGKFIMHTAAFYVRNRVVMKDWPLYRTGMKNVSLPSFNLNDVVTSARTNVDWNAHISSFGIDTNAKYYTKDSTSGAQRSIKASLLPFRCYQRIWWDWFRNSMVLPDTQESSYIYNDNNSESYTLYTAPKFCNWDKDFMSNFLRTPNADGRTTGVSSSSLTIAEAQGVKLTPNGVVSGNPFSPTASQNHQTASANDANLAAPFVSGTTSTSIASLRTSLGLQAVIEKMNALGGRLKDRLKGMFGSSVSYETLGMSELLGYNEYEVRFENESSPVGTTTDDTDINAFGASDPRTAQMKGQLTGKSTMTENGLSGINYHCTEDGYFLIVSWLTPDAMLSKGMDAMWFRGVDGVAPSRFDFLTDEFVGKGFDPVKAIDCVTVPYQLTDFGPYDPFKAVGFNAKYHDYTYHHDVVSGDFVRDYTRPSMKNWFLERDILKENHLVDNTGSLITGTTGTQINDVTTFDKLQGLNSFTKAAYDSNFMYTNPDVDHFVIQNKCELVMTRRLPSAPRVDMLTQSPAETGIGGTRL